MVFDECHFHYGTFDSKDYGLIFAHVDTSEFTQLMGELDSSYVFNRRTKSRFIIADNWEDSPLSYDAEIVSEDTSPLSKENRRIIEKALFNIPDFRKLYVDTDDDIYDETQETIDGQLKRLYLNCRFVNPSKIENDCGQVVGYNFTIECDSSMAWQDAIEKTFSITSPNEIVSVDIDTDVGGYTYPEVTITVGQTGGDIIIVNTTDDPARLTKFVNISPNITLTLKGELNYISGQNYAKFANQNFVRLLDGNNSISVTGDVTSIKFKWNNRRFL